MNRKACIYCQQIFSLSLLASLLFSLHLPAYRTTVHYENYEAAKGECGYKKVGKDKYVQASLLCYTYRKGSDQTLIATDRSGTKQARKNQKVGRYAEADEQKKVGSNHCSLA